MHAFEADPAPPARDRTLGWAMIVAAIAVTAARWAFSGDRRVFHVSPDEPSQIAIARWLAGGRWNMFDHATWQPGLGTLLTPIFWFTDDGTTAVRAALAVNAVIAGLSAALLVVLTRRLTGLGPVASAVVAVIVGVAPASLSASSFVWAEPLVSLGFLGTVLMLFRWFDTGRVSAGIGAVAVAVAGYTSHSRLLVLVATTIVATVGVALWRRHWVDAATLTVASVVLFGASAGWTRWILSNVWDDPSDQNTVGSVWERAQQPVEIADAILGQVWYQGAATAGIAFIGTAILLESALRRRPSSARPDATDGTVSPSPWPADARVLLWSTVPLILLSAVFMADRPRPDQFIYGRYNDAVVWPVIAIGLAWLGRRARTGFTRRQSVLVIVSLASILGTGLAVDALHGDAIRERYGVRGMIAGLLAFVDSDDTLDVWRTSIMSSAIFAGLVAVAVLASRKRFPDSARIAIQSLGLAVVAALLVVAGIRTEHVADLRLNGWERTSAVAAVEDFVPEGVALGVRPVPSSQDPVVEWVPQRQRFQLYQLWLPDRTFVRDRGITDDVGPYVFAPLEDETMIDAGATLLWRDPGIRVGLWKEPDST